MYLCVCMYVYIYIYIYTHINAMLCYGITHYEYIASAQAPPVTLRTHS